MRLRDIFWIAALALTACGPGAGQRPILDKSEATYEFPRANYWTPPERLGGALTGEWSCEGTCATTTDTTTKPPAGLKELRSTFAGPGDANTGVVVWRGQMPADVSSIALPMVTGPDPARTRVTVKCGAITRTLLPKDMWDYRRLTLKRRGGVCQLEIRATDGGAAWGQWVAIGTPEMVR
jgi:hypothetical protein